MHTVIVIGAGLGGLSTALRLRHHGYEVIVLEKLARPGGRSNRIEENGYCVDTGPTILVMREIFEEFYHSIGQNLGSRLNFVQIDPNYRTYFHDGTQLDLYSNMARLAEEIERFEPGAAESLFSFLGANANKYRLGMPFVERNYRRITDLANPVAGWRLLQTRAHQNLYRQVSQYFKDERLQKAFSFHPMFLGLSPFDAPAMYSMITYADIALGMWYPKGGIYALIEDMLALAAEMGVEVRTNSPVQRILTQGNKVAGVRLSSGEVLSADLVVSNADLPYTYQHLLNGEPSLQADERRLSQMKYSCSGYLLYLGVDKTYPHLRHQALYFSADYRRNLDSIFKDKTLPEDPSFHLSIPTQTDPSLAPPGHSLFYVLAPMPNLEAGIDWSQAGTLVREQLIERLTQIVDPDLRRHIVWERQYTPTDFQRDYNAVHGTAFGSLAHNFFQSAYFRPHNKATGVEGLYFVGQGTYPGIGMPMVLISSRLVVERIISEC